MAKIPKSIEENIGSWVSINSTNGNSYIGVLESFDFEDGFTLRPSLIYEPLLEESDKPISQYRLEEKRPMNITNHTGIVPLSKIYIRSYLTLNRNKKSSENQNKNPNQLELSL